ncbi:ergothioneine biosynthesis protein EgtB [Methylohalobius crimeensis]|uniref:ergothioneine biosynthesis protein EgtB n=1 Tax=Methylohalobius crimeensis TaxID=244365 RepID=UPI0003B7107C|nr:ergothioneine biosynthesis protein EgtB [Methylohalobius crimeensis]
MIADQSEIGFSIKAYGEDDALARLLDRYREVRRLSEELCQPLATEDYIIQTMADVSPPKWHLAHCSWFFERFLLRPHLQDYRCFHPRYDYLFNSYYESVGRFWPRPRRGLLSRPTVDEITAYRKHVDEGMERLFAGCATVAWSEAAPLIELGLNHEQQHQELLLTDIKHIFAVNPLRPVYREMAEPHPAGLETIPLKWHEFEGGLHSIGDSGEGFAYDNEGPRHRVHLEDFRLASRLVTNGEYLAFMEAGGYREPRYWLSEGWAKVREEGWEAPLYWEKRDGEWWQMTLSGMRPVAAEEAVCHLSYFEADAYARWAGRRLPTEAEWEVAAARQPIDGNFLESRALHPRPAPSTAENRPLQLFGDVWEWTASTYAPYPGYRPPAGPIGEYNGKFMCSQMVLRGGSCVSSRTHLRASYRNFFYPKDRWQFSGLRLADNL